SGRVRRSLTGANRKWKEVIMVLNTNAAAVNGRRPNLLVLGASGHVAHAFLRRLGGRRNLFGRVVLLDESEQILKDPFLEHQRLRYQFIHHRLQWPDDGSYRELLRRYEIDIVLDLTDRKSVV